MGLIRICNALGGREPPKGEGGRLEINLANIVQRLPPSPSVEISGKEREMAKGLVR